MDSRGKADDTSSEHLLYFLVEHKARPERMVAVQLLSYAAAILEQHRGRSGGTFRRRRKCPQGGRGASLRSPLPRLHIAVLYHGVAKWAVPKRLSALQGYDGSGTTEPTVELAYRLVNLSEIALDQERLSAEALAGFIVMRSVLRKLETDQLRLIRDLLRNPRLNDSWVARAIRYFLSYTPEESYRKMVPILEESRYTDKRGMRMYTAADYLIDQGLEKGRKEGLSAGQRQAQVNIAKRMLARGIDVQTVCETTELSEDDVRTIQQTGDAPQDDSASE